VNDKDKPDDTRRRTGDFQTCLRESDMLVTDLDHVDGQCGKAPDLERAIDFLRSHDISNLPDGTVKIDGERVFAIVQRYETGAAGVPKFEYHRKYIDVQFIASGEETIGWVPVGRMHITEAYDAGKDIAFGTAEQGEWTAVHLRAGQLAVLYPEDGHAPRLAKGGPSLVKKIVVKIAV
jgi:biofilm protein TabA